MNGKIISQRKVALAFLLLVITLFIITVATTAARIYVPSPASSGSVSAASPACGSPGTPLCDAQIIVQFNPLKVGERAGLL